jgi:hypothetical protein
MLMLYKPSLCQPVRGMFQPSLLMLICCIGSLLVSTNGSDSRKVGGKARTNHLAQLQPVP